MKFTEKEINELRNYLETVLGYNILAIDNDDEFLNVIVRNKYVTACLIETVSKKMDVIFQGVNIQEKDVFFITYEKK